MSGWTVRVGNDQICVIITAGKGDDHSEDNEPSSVVPMTTVMMIRVGNEAGSVCAHQSEDDRVGNDQICVIITAGEEGICVIITAGKGDEIGSLTNGV